MKTFQILIIATIICMFKTELDFERADCEAYEPDGKSAFSLDFCRSTYFSDEFYRCCFIKYKDTNDNRQYHCLGLDFDDFSKIDDIIDSLEAGSFVTGINEVTSLDCSSNFLFSSILLLLLSLLF